jgi:hypothetical protein
MIASPTFSSRRAHAPTETQELDGEAILDACLWDRAERLYHRELLLSSTCPSRLLCWDGLDLAARLAWWDRAFEEIAGYLS